MPYFLIVALQVFCVYHILKNENDWKWILFIIFVPALGSLVYIVSKVFNQKKIGQEFKAVQSDFGNILNPTGRIKELEKQVEFSDTFVNKVALGDAYLVNKKFDEAIATYESSLNGVFEEDSHVNHQLMNAYFHKEAYREVIQIAERAQKNTATFQKSNARVLYALSLEKIGELDDAESIFKSMNGQYSDLEPRIIYGQFLARQNRMEDAKRIFDEIVKEGEHMGKVELRGKRQWLQQAKVELKQFR